MPPLPPVTSTARPCSDPVPRNPACSSTTFPCPTQNPVRVRCPTGLTVSIVTAGT
jgi:hypothetical protein